MIHTNIDDFVENTSVKMPEDTMFILVASPSPRPELKEINFITFEFDSAKKAADHIVAEYDLATKPASLTKYIHKAFKIDDDLYFYWKRWNSWVKLDNFVEGEQRPIYNKMMGVEIAE